MHMGEVSFPTVDIPAQNHIQFRVCVFNFGDGVHELVALVFALAHILVPHVLPRRDVAGERRHD